LNGDFSWTNKQCGSIMSKKEGSDCYKRNTRKIQIRRYNNMVFS
jgi:hypothetical protein